MQEVLSSPEQWQSLTDSFAGFFLYLVPRDSDLVGPGPVRYEPLEFKNVPN